MTYEIPSGKYLGNLCKRSHEWNGTGQSLRYLKANRCVECQAEVSKKWKTANSEKIKDRNKKYRENNKEKNLLSQKLCRVKKIEKYRATERERYNPLLSL